jgi:phosphonopyruvate decarboxylase
MRPRNLVHFVYENGTYDTTGGQPIPGAGTIDFAVIASGAGYPSTYTFATLEDLEQGIGAALSAPAPVLIVLKVRSGADQEDTAGRPREALLRVRDLLAKEAP